MKNLVFDIQITGHHVEYIQHLVDFLYDKAVDCDYYFIVNPSFSEKFPGIVTKARKNRNVFWQEITNEEWLNCKSGGMTRKSFSTFQLMHKYATKFRVDHACLLYFNTFQLACAIYRPSYTISGILFLQFYRMNKNTWKEKVKFYRKYFTTKLFVCNPKIRQLYVLNDQKSVEFFNFEFKTNIFKVLPDPIPELQPLENFDIYNHYGIERSRKIFLHIGSLGDRKGTFDVIQAASQLPKDIQKICTILLVGKAGNKETELKISRSIVLARKESETTLIWHNDFVSNKLMKSLFNQCFAVLMPYKNAEASSGILGHASCAKKPVIATGKGLIKEIIKENNLGILMDSLSAEEISRSISCLVHQKFHSDSENFVKEHKPEIFSEILIND